MAQTIKKLTGKVPSEVHRRVRMAALERGMTVDEIIERAVVRYLDEPEEGGAETGELSPSERRYTGLLIDLLRSEEPQYTAMLRAYLDEWPKAKKQRSKQGRA